MTKTAKNKEVLDQLYELVVKQASAPKPVASGVPGKEPTIEAVSEKHDHVDQNAVKPEALKPQAHEQKPSTDPSKPVATAKKADETEEVAKEAAPVVVPAEKKAEAPEANVSVEKLGNDILALVQKFANNPVATGVPGKDPKWEAVSEKHEHVDQNAVKPETLAPQAHQQKPSTDPAKPVATAKKAEDEKVDAEKVASYELGKLWADLVIKKAQEEQAEQIKEAGRRDFELLVTQAAAQLKQADSQKVAKAVKTAAVDNSVDMEKAAEAQGAAAFEALYKQAQAEQAIAGIMEQNKQLTAKLAEMEKIQIAKEAEMNSKLMAKQAELDKAAAEEREQQKFAALATHLEQRIVERLQREIAGRPV